MPNYHELKMSAIDSLKERLTNLDNEREDDISDIIHEVTENWIPVYNHEVIEIASSNLNLVCVKSELWPAYGDDYPINRIIANIYDMLSEDLYEWYQSRKE